MYERGAKRITSINPWLRFYFIRLANKTMFTNISNICIRILMMENIRYLDRCVKNLLFMYKVSTYFCRQCLNGLARYSQCLDPHDDQIDSSESWSLEPAQFPAAASRQAQGIMMDTLSTINHPQPQIRLVSDVSSMILLCYGYELLFV